MDSFGRPMLQSPFRRDCDIETRDEFLKYGFRAWALVFHQMKENCVMVLTPKEQDEVDRIVQRLVETHRLKWYQHIVWKVQIPCLIAGIILGFLIGHHVI